VSTDDAEVSLVAAQEGAEIPFERPASLADDLAGTAPVIRHAIEELALEPLQLVLCLYPTAAIDSAILDSALKLAETSGLPDRFLISVGKHRSPHERSLVATAEALMKLASREALLTRTQDLPQRYFDAGKIYLAHAETWMKHETMMAKPFLPFPLPAWATIDMDEPEDWPIAEALHRSFGSL
jgi:CMP-N-acetylneuraminic acid synthetase